MGSHMSSRWIESALLFLSLYIVLASWIGLVSFQPVLILLLAILASFFLLKKNPAENVALPRTAIALAILGTVLAAYPLVLIHPPFDSSADGLHSVISRALSSAPAIPKTFQPYSEISLNYTIGFHLLSASVYQFIPIEPISLLNWFFGMVFVFLGILSFYLFSRELIRSDHAAIFSTILLLGSKIIFQNAYFGLYPYIAGNALVFFGSFLLLRKNRLFWAVLPAVFLLNPGSAINAMLLFSFLSVLRPSVFFTRSIPWIALSIPEWGRTYSILFYNLLFGHSAHAAAPLLPATSTIVSALLWMGWVPLVGVIASIALAWKKGFDELTKHLLLFFAASLLLYFLVNPLSQPFAGKLVELVAVAAILFSSAVLCSRRWIRKIDFQKPAVLALLLFIVLGTFFFSTTLSHLRDGSKISLNDAELAFSTFQKNPAPEKAFYFIPPNQASPTQKFSEYANKMPYDILENGMYLFPINESQIDKAEYAALQQKHLQSVEIVQTGCLACAASLDVNYIVLSRSLFRPLPGFAETASNQNLVVLRRTAS